LFSVKLCRRRWRNEKVHPDRPGCDRLHRGGDTRIERGRFDRHRVRIPGFLRLSRLLPIRLLSVRLLSLRRALLLQSGCLLRWRLPALLLVAWPPDILSAPPLLALNSLQPAGAVLSQTRLSSPNVFGQRSRHARNTGLRPVWRTSFKASDPSRSLAVPYR